MSVPLILATILIPIAIGLLVIWLVFRNINRKYVDLFTRLAETARQAPDRLAEILNPDTQKRQAIIAALAGINTVLRIEVLRAGKENTLLELTARSGENQATYHATLIRHPHWNLAEMIRTA